MKSNITLIGMPGAGKSTIGIILAKLLSYGFIDTDILIQINEKKPLQRIIDESDYLNLRKIEEREIVKIHVHNHIIATGGSAVYSKKAMTHLQKMSSILFLRVSYEEIKRRIHNFESRGIAKAKYQTFRELYDERQVLYNKYAELTVDCDDLDQEETAQLIVKKIFDKQGEMGRS